MEKIQRHSKSGNNLSKLYSCGLHKGTDYFQFTFVVLIVLIGFRETSISLPVQPLGSTQGTASASKFEPHKELASTI